MKVPCTITHEKPLGEGRFKIYEAGKSYEVENPDPKYFDVPGEPQTKTAAEAEKIGDPREPQTKTAAEAEKIGDPPIRKNKIEDLPKRKGGYER